MTKKPLQRFRIFIFAGIILIFYSILVIRLGSLQVESSNKYAEKIAIQSIRRVRVPGTRGRIFSSDGKVIADNIPSYDIVFHLAEMRKYGRTRTVNYIYKCALELAVALNRPLGITKKDIIKQINLRPAIPITIFKNLTKEELAIASEYTPPIPGMEIVAIPIRYYPYRSTACHIIGYTGNDDPLNAPDRSDYSYYIPDKEGRGGLEKMLDKKIKIGPEYSGLRGKAGDKLLRVNVKGYVHDVIGTSNSARNGNNVELTINWEAQMAAEKVLKGKKGSFILLNAKTGAVLAMASSPSYDLNLFTDGISKDNWNKLLKDPDRPLFNRALMGQYMPGSIVKPIVALAALKDGVNPNDEIYCNGAAKIGNSKIRCWIWRYGGHGNETMADAIRDSCNVYFVETGLKLGLDKIAEMYDAAGIGKKTGIGLPERSGQLPSRELKKRLIGRSWTAFDTGLISIGQGMLTLTPIQAVIYTAAIANGGTIWKPYLVNKIFNYNDKLLYSAKPHFVRRLPVTLEDLEVVKAGMYESVHAENGSSKRANNKYITLFGKTGTAQVGPPTKRHKNTWFIGFGEHNENLYSIVVSVEDGRAGGLTNAPMVKEFFTLWLGKNQ